MKEIGMTGPEHYCEAERLLVLATNAERGSRAESGIFAEAQVHATLALAAATAAGLASEMATHTGNAWQDAADTPAT